MFYIIHCYQSALNMDLNCSVIPLINLVFLVCRVSNGPSFFPLSIYGPRAKHAENGGKRGSITCSTDREDKVSNLYLCVCWVRKRFLFTRNGFKFPMHVKSKTSQL